MQHESLYKISNLLDQFKDGLNAVNVLTLVKIFPQQMFTYSGEIRNEEVLQALYVNEDEDLDSVHWNFCKGIFVTFQKKVCTLL